MVTVVRKQRKSPVLTPSKIPCLSKLPTINITLGCSLGCTYCYTQSYANYPGSDRVVLHENTADLVRDELKRKRKKPTRVYFSPSSEAFQQMPEVQKVTLDTMSVLLEAGVEVAFLTKGFITDPFVELFAKYQKSVFAQIGITTVDAQICGTIEPRAATPQQRLDTIAALSNIGVRTTARLDPLIPDLTDKDQNLIPLFDRLREAGVTNAAASFLFLRSKLIKQTTAVLDNMYPSAIRHIIESWPHQDFADGCGGGKMIDYDERERRFNRIQALGQAAGIQVAICACKNPRLGGIGCEIMGPVMASSGNPQEQGLLNFAETANGDCCGDP